MNVPDGWEQVGWIDEYGQLWSLNLRNGSVPSDRQVYAPPRVESAETAGAHSQLPGSGAKS